MLTDKRFTSRLILLTLLSFSLLSFTSCQLIGDIFRAGIWTGIILVVLVVAIIIYVIAKIGKK